MDNIIDTTITPSMEADIAAMEENIATMAAIMAAMEANMATMAENTLQLQRIIAAECDPQELNRVLWEIVAESGLDVEATLREVRAGRNGRL